MVRHFEDAADVGRLRFVEEEIRLRRVRVDAVFAFEEAEGDERIEKVTRCTRMQPHAALHAGEITGMFGQIREDLHFDGGKQGLGGPEGQAGLQDVVRGEVHRGA